LLDGNYTRAIKLYDTLESRFPYGRFAQQAILEGAYANYRAGETATAVAACDRFIRTFPNNPSVDYAYYLKGWSTFARTRASSDMCTSSTSPSESRRG
jgi:outer membrane protein assembly factor BamD